MSEGAVPQIISLHSASELPSGGWVEKDIAKRNPLDFIIGRAEACSLLFACRLVFPLRAPLLVTPHFSGLRVVRMP
jgi:hypothetical protein